MEAPRGLLIWLIFINAPEGCPHGTHTSKWDGLYVTLAPCVRMRNVCVLDQKRCDHAAHHSQPGAHSLFPDHRATPRALFPANPSQVRPPAPPVVLSVEKQVEKQLSFVMLDPVSRQHEPVCLDPCAIEDDARGRGGERSISYKLYSLRVLERTLHTSNTKETTLSQF